MELDLTQQEPLFACPNCGRPLTARYYHMEAADIKLLVMDCDYCLYCSLIDTVKGGTRS